MMRVALAVLVGCGSTSPDATSNRSAEPPNLAAMSEDQRCTAVAARAVPCMNEVFNAEVMSTAGIDMSDEPKSDEVEREKLHRIRCQVGPEYADAIVTCWSERGCQAFAACVDRTEGAAVDKLPKRHPEPLRLDP